MYTYLLYSRLRYLKQHGRRKTMGICLLACQVYTVSILTLCRLICEIRSSIASSHYVFRINIQILICFLCFLIIRT